MKTRPKRTDGRTNGRARSMMEVLPPYKNSGKYQHRVLIGTPTMGTVRIEWHHGICGLVIPTNWANSTQSPIGFHTPDGQNLIVDEAIRRGFEWVLFIEDDVVVPCDTLIRLLPYLEKGNIPVVSGLYHLKGARQEPMIYRGRGNGAFRDWKPGEKVWADGVPTGCLLVHASILKVYADEADSYVLRSNGANITLKKIFESPRLAFTDAGAHAYQKLIGTSDLYFCDEVGRRGILKKAGWGDIAKRKFPFLVDTSIRCGHVDRETGVIW